ncbi:MAG: (deoxy)nucleoside triphosphate pyrophosphohydrolase [Candidatus Izemoplasmatales bacterium]|nr:(deoxy)nucleoside triphosphate pyrophosphohydrolase [Candidatus Izemoplasmatales bacterium]
MKKHIEVVAAVIERNGTYFCAQRKDQGELAKKWEFPGGKVELGETKEEALIREIKEELDSLITVDQFLMTIHHEYNTFVITMHCYKCTLIKGTLVLSEHINSKWATVEKMRSIDFAQADKPIIEMLQNNKGNI